MIGCHHSYCARLHLEQCFLSANRGADSWGKGERELVSQWPDDME